MLSPSRYAAMFDALAEREVQLRTTPDSFRTAHHLPLWFPTMEGLTPESVWTTGNDWAAFDEALLGFGEGAAVLKDYSKSEKHYWHEAMFIPDVQDLPSARAVAERFVELRGSSFDSGFVLRRFEDLSDIEARSWWVDGECVGVSAHPDAPDSEIVEFDSDLFGGQVGELGLPFVTIDVALTDSGSPRVVEVGDGQVSDRPASLDPGDFIQMVSRSG